MTVAGVEEQLLTGAGRQWKIRHQNTLDCPEPQGHMVRYRNGSF